MITPTSLHALDGSSASGYPTNMGIFQALCPSRAMSSIY